MVRGRRAGVIAVATVAGMLLTACAEGSSRTQSGGAGLPFGSTRDAYRDAFADIDPITINLQSSSAKGGLSGRKFEEYAAAITDWSNGKVAFEIAYSNAIAPPQEVDNALVDGRLDLGSPLPLYEPAEFPASDAYVSSMVLGRQSPIAGLLQVQGWISQVGYESDEIVQEFERNGMHMLLPAFSAGGTALLCQDQPRNTSNTISGAQVGITSTAQVRQIQDLGGTPISVVYPEIFESLQRGLIDCTTSILGAAVLGGFVSEAPHIVIDEEVGFGIGPGTLAMSLPVWNALPLIAQQLFYDRLDSFLGANFEATWENIAEAGRQAEAVGGQFVQFDEDSRRALAETNETTLDRVRGSTALGDGQAFVDSAVVASNEWGTEVDSLGYVDEVGYGGFGDWYEKDSIDLDPYFAKLLGEVLLEYRPS